MDGSALALGWSRRVYPPPEIRAWRDLTRTRVALVQTRTQVQNRLSKVWEDTNIKVAPRCRTSLATVGAGCSRRCVRANATRKSLLLWLWGPYAASCPSWNEP